MQHPGNVPGHSKNKKVTLACRPSEIDLQNVEGIKGIVKRKVYLGDMIDYRINVGKIEIRVQKNRRRGFFNEGETCRLKFNKLLWYDRET